MHGILVKNTGKQGLGAQLMLELESQGLDQRASRLVAIPRLPHVFPFGQLNLCLGHRCKHLLMSLLVLEPLTLLQLRVLIPKLRQILLLEAQRLLRLRNITRTVALSCFSARSVARGAYPRKSLWSSGITVASRAGMRLSAASPSGSGSKRTMCTQRQGDEQHKLLDRVRRALHVHAVGIERVQREGLAVEEQDLRREGLFLRFRELREFDGEDDGQARIRVYDGAHLARDAVSHVDEPLDLREAQEVRAVREERQQMQIPPLHSRLADINVQSMQLDESAQDSPSFMDLILREDSEEQVRLTKEKSHLQNSINSFIYPILTVPVEITSEIFGHCLPDAPTARNDSTYTSYSYLPAMEGHINQ
ncbi:hypothetical protein DFH09DRAFT_1359685 [Mycena vulgaris]|nr:hypothetical protein DFH09DRAFT_1359685 [Mycena vulgaris]